MKIVGMYPACAALLYESIHRTEVREDSVATLAAAQCLLNIFFCLKRCWQCFMSNVGLFESSVPIVITACCVFFK